MIYLAYAPSEETLTAEAVRLGLSRYNLIAISETEFSEIPHDVRSRVDVTDDTLKDGNTYVYMPKRAFLMGEGTKKKVMKTIEYFSTPLATMNEWLAAARPLLQTHDDAEAQLKIEMRLALEKEVSLAIADMERAVSDGTFRRSPKYGKFLLGLARDAGVDMTKYDAYRAAFAWTF